MRPSHSVVALATSLLLLGVAPSSFEFKTYQDFSGGDAVGVSVVSVGALTLAPQSAKIADLDDKTVWAILPSPDAAFVAAGEEGKVFLVGKGDPIVFFTSSEPFVYALANAGKSGFFAASSPDGKVYLVNPDGTSSVFYEPGTKYIWALAVDGDRSLWVATGNPGKLVKVPPNGSATLMYETGDDQVRSIALSPDGAVYFGTSGEGIVYRLEREGKAFALYDSDLTEINALFADRSGRVWALATSAPAGGPRQGPSIPGLPNIPLPPGLANEVQSMMQSMLGGGEEDSEREGPPAPQPRGKSALLQVSADGSSRIVWSSNRDSAYAMAPTDKGTFIVGTGENGNLLEVDSRGNETLLAHLQETQINNVAYVSRDRILVATSNAAAVYSFSASPVKTGAFTSRVLDARGISHWGAFRVISKPAFKARASCSTRSGNTQKINATWSDWEPIRDNKVVSPSARFIQWKCELSAAEMDVPVVTSVELSYMQTNLPPKVTEVKVLPPGPPRKTPDQAARGGAPGSSFMDSAQEFLQQAMSSSFAAMTEAMESAEDAAAADQMPGRPPVPVRRGWRTVTWKASDPNRDPLKYSLYFRLVGESNWKLLKNNLKVIRHNWDASSFPDGHYELRVVASDDLANPAPVALSDELISDPFIIDNTPPEVLNLKAVVERNKAVVTFAASDRWLPLDGCDYAIDAGDWIVILPTDGIPDSTQEYFAFSTPELSRGEHTIMLRVNDIAQNPAYASITISIP
jgi:hypothetical protein